MRVKTPEERVFYEHEAIEEGWSVRALQRQYDNLAGDDKRFRPKEWDAEIKDFEQKLAETNKEYVNLITSLATAEVIKYNKRDLERQIQNEERQNSKNHEFAKSRNNIDL